jgi:hypothetical protein
VRLLVTATMAASALAIGFGMDAAQSLYAGGLLGDKAGRPDGPAQLVQQKDRGMSPGMGGSGRGGGPAMRDGGGGLRQDGSQFRSGDRGMRGDGGGRAERGARGERGGGEFGYRERGGRGYVDRDRGDRDRGYRDRGDRDRHRFGGRGGIYFGPGYGYLPSSCSWLRRRALETDSPYWWRRYRACRGG